MKLADLSRALDEDSQVV